jgi:hypothetical protein
MKLYQYKDNINVVDIFKFEMAKSNSNKTNNTYISQFDHIKRKHIQRL